MTPPRGWRKALLRDVAIVQTGLSKSENRAGPFVRKPYLRVANVQDGYLDLREIKEIDVPASQVERFQLRLHDILLTEGGDFDKVGRGAIWVGEVPDCVHQNHIFAVRVIKTDEMLPQFLACLIQSPVAKSYFLSCAKQTTNLASINSSQIKELPVLLPSLLEQGEIVRAISIWDAAIKKTEQLIAVSKKKHQAICNRIFASPQNQSPTKVGPALRRADQLFETTSIKGQQGEPLLSVTQERGVIPRDMLEGRVTMPSGETSSFKLVEPGNFVISLRSFQGGLEHSAFRGLVSPAYTVLRAIQPISDRYFRHYFRSVDFIKRLSVAVVGIRDGKQISYQDFCSIKLPSPALGRQKAIANVLDEAEREMALLRNRAEALKEQKRGLMQKLLTGQWRLKMPASEAAE